MHRLVRWAEVPAGCVDTGIRSSSAKQGEWAWVRVGETSLQGTWIGHGNFRVMSPLPPSGMIAFDVVFQRGRKGIVSLGNAVFHQKRN